MEDWLFIAGDPVRSLPAVELELDVCWGRGRSSGYGGVTLCFDAGDGVLISCLLIRRGSTIGDSAGTGGEDRNNSSSGTWRVPVELMVSSSMSHCKLYPVLCTLYSVVPAPPRRCNQCRRIDLVVDQYPTTRRTFRAKDKTAIGTRWVQQRSFGAEDL